MNRKTSWSLAEFEDFYHIAKEHHANLMILVRNVNTLQQYPHYIVHLNRLSAVLSEIEADKNLEIVSVVKIKPTFEETLASHEECFSDDRLSKSCFFKWRNYYKCTRCGCKAVKEPLYDYVVGKPLQACPYCGHDVDNPKRQEWMLMRLSEKIRAIMAGIVITAVHGFTGGLLAGLVAIAIKSILSFDSKDIVFMTVIFGASISALATLYCRFGGIPKSLKRTKDKDYIERLYSFGAAERRTSKKKSKEEPFSWENLNQNSLSVDYHRADGEIERAYIEHLLNAESIQNYLFCIGVIYSHQGQMHDGLWIKKSLPGQGALLRALATVYRPQIYSNFTLDKIQMPLGSHNRMILLTMEKKDMIEAMGKYCVEDDAKTETDLLADSSFDRMFDLIQMMYHMEETNDGSFYFAVGIGCIE